MNTEKTEVAKPVDNKTLEHVSAIRAELLGKIQAYHQQNMAQLEAIRQILKDNKESIDKFQARRDIQNPFRRQ